MRDTADNDDLIDVEIEQELLSWILFSNALMAQVPQIKEAHFGHPLHRVIWREIETQIAAGQTATPVSLRSWADGLPAAEGDMSVMVYLDKIVRYSRQRCDMPGYAGRIIDLARQRQLHLMATELLEGLSKRVPTGELVSSAEELLSEVTATSASRKTLMPLKVALEQAEQRINDAYKGKQTRGISTGFHDLDEMLGKLMPGNLVVLAGRPSMGKTALATDIAVRNARQGKRVLFFSQEMSAEELALRLISESSEVNGMQLRRGKASEDETMTALRHAAAMRSLPLDIEEAGGVTLMHVSLLARRMALRSKLDLIVVDYLQLMRAVGRHQNRVGEITEITTGLKALAKELGVPILALSQLSRKVEERQDKRPQLSDLRESGSIEQDADIVMFVYRDEYYLSREVPERGTAAYEAWRQRTAEANSVAEVIIGKARHGATGTVNLRFNATTTSFDSLETQHAAPQVAQH